VAITVSGPGAAGGEGNSKTILSAKPIMLTLEDKIFLLVIIAVSLAFGAILWPFFGAVL
jgi:hypothetical protein